MDDNDDNESPTSPATPATVADLDLSPALSDAANRWADWNKPAADVTVDDVRRWAMHAGEALADAFVRWLKFGTVYAVLPTADKKRFRDAWGRGMSHTYACDAARCATYLIEVCGGVVPDGIEGPRDLIAAERAHNTDRVKKAKDAYKAEKERAVRVQEERDAEHEEDNPRPDADANPADDEPVIHHVLGLKTWLTEHPDTMVPNTVVLQVKALLADLERRSQSTPSTSSGSQWRVEQEPVDDELPVDTDVVDGGGAADDGLNDEPPDPAEEPQESSPAHAPATASTPSVKVRGGDVDTYILAALDREAPKTVRGNDVVEYVSANYHDQNAPKATLERRVRDCLTGLRKTGVLVSEGKGPATRWARATAAR